MGAVPPVSPWIPEDDLLLKNAVEAGASLEALAKGAVKFSRKFSVHELQERWHSLLYDPVISEAASTLMMEVELANLSSKCNKSGNSKDSKSPSVKRKSESVRNCYYSMRKRVRNEPFDSMNMSFLVRTGSDHYLGNGNEPLAEHCIFGNPESSHYELQESNLGIGSLACAQADSSSGQIFKAHFQDSVPEGCLRKQDGLHIEGSHMVEEFGQREELLMNDDVVQGGTKLDGDQVFTSPLPDCSSSFRTMGYPSPLSEMPLWRTVEGISEQGIQVNLGLREKDVHTEDAFLLSGDDTTRSNCTSEYDIFHQDSSIKLEISPQELKNSNACPEGYLSELSNSLLDFTHDEILLMEADGKDGIDKSYYDGLSSLLLNSPKDVGQGEMAHTTEPESSQRLDFPKPESSTCPLDKKDKGNGQCGDIGSSEVQVPTSMVTVDPQCLEMKDGVICCILLTEDSEIPCNDHIVFTNHLVPKSTFPSGRGSTQDAGKPKFSSFKEVSGIQNNKECLQSADRHFGNPGQYKATCQTVRAQVASKVGLLPLGGADFELFNSDTSQKSAGVAYGSTSNNSTSAGMETMMHARMKDKSTVIASKGHLNHNVAGSLWEGPAFGSASCEYYRETNACGVKREFDTMEQSHSHRMDHAKTGPTDTTIVENHLTSDLEEPAIESEDDIPYFSDIEAMILEMDLDPEDQDIYSSAQALKYQNEDTRKTIMRLEQGAHSYMQRAIASHGAFAVLYGRNSKHYIKKPEVLLGRATEDVNVDIDLGMEGRANKISRRQAIIKLDKGGAFLLKNLGKCSISVNDMELAYGQTVDLTSSCLIEIRGLSFIFEINQTSVQRYLDNVIRINEIWEPKVRITAEI